MQSNRKRRMPEEENLEQNDMQVTGHLDLQCNFWNILEMPSGSIRIPAADKLEEFRQGAISWFDSINPRDAMANVVVLQQMPKLIDLFIDAVKIWQEGSMPVDRETGKRMVTNALDMLRNFVASLKPTNEEACTINNAMQEGRPFSEQDEGSLARMKCFLWTKRSTLEKAAVVTFAAIVTCATLYGLLCGIVGMAGTATEIAGAVGTGTTQAAEVVAQGITNATEVVATGTTQAAEVVVTGTAQAAGVVAQGITDAAEVVATGTTQAAEVVVTGTAQAAGVVAEGITDAAGVAAQGIVDAAGVVATGTAKAAGAVATGTAKATGVLVAKAIFDAAGLLPTGTAQAAGVVGAGTAQAAGVVGAGTAQAAGIAGVAAATGASMIMDRSSGRRTRSASRRLAAQKNMKKTN